jgi:hypothetical protein
MSTLTTRPAESLASTPPPLSADVKRAVMEWAHWGTLAKPVTLAVHDQIRFALAEWSRVCAPASPAYVEQWLRGINPAVRNPKPREALSSAAAILADTCAGLPGCVFNAATQREARQKFDFFPSDAEVYALLGPHARQFSGPLLALHALAKATPAREHARPSAPSVAECQAVREKVATYAAEMAARQGPAKPPLPDVTVKGAALDQLRRASPLAGVISAAVGATSDA